MYREEWKEDFEDDWREEEEQEDEEVEPAWTERYLNTLGMSMRDFL